MSGLRFYCNGRFHRFTKIHYSEQYLHNKIKITSKIIIIIHES